MEEGVGGVTLHHRGALQQNGHEQRVATEIAV